MSFDYDTILTVLSLRKDGRYNKIEVIFDRFEPFIFSLDVVNEFKLKKGFQITIRDLFDIVLFQMAYDAKQEALRLIARRPHSEQEIRKKLAKKNIEENVIDLVIDFLIENKYIDDFSYFTDYAQWLIERRFFGRSRVEQELLKRGADKNMLNNICDNLFKEQEKQELEFAKKLLGKRTATINRKAPEKRKNYIYNMLSRYGISSKVIRQILEKYNFPDVDETF